MRGDLHTHTDTRTYFSDVGQDSPTMVNIGVGYYTFSGSVLKNTYIYG